MRRLAFARWLLVWLPPALGAVAVCAAVEGPSGGDVLPEHHNALVTGLTEDCESVRLTLGAAWDDCLACRALSGYLRPWTQEDSREAAEALIRRGAASYEHLKCVDDGIGSVRLLRDSRDKEQEPQLLADARFWRNELALAARQVVRYAEEAAALRGRLETQLRALAAQRGIAAQQVQPVPWADPQREAWRRAGPAVGVRLPLEPFPGSYPQWWNRHLSLGDGYLVAKLRSAGDVFFTTETPIGAWGHNCPARGRYDWAGLDRIIRLVRDRGGRLLLELPTLQERRGEDEIAKAREEALRRSLWILPRGYAHALPADLAAGRSSLIARDEDGTLRPQGGVQLLDPATAAAYSEYLTALAAYLKSAGLYDAIAALHLEMGDAAELPENVDYSDLTRQRWREFLRQRYGEIGALNRAAGMSHASFADVPIPFRAVPPQAAADWQEFIAARWRRHLTTRYKRIAELNKAAGTEYKTFEEVRLGPAGPADANLAADWKELRQGQRLGNDWVSFLVARYKPAGSEAMDPQLAREEASKKVRQKLGDDYQDGYESRLPHDYPPVLKIDYLHFRRAWVREYLAIKRQLVEAAFPDRLAIAEPWQFGDHDGVQGKGECKWGGFAADDYAQWTGTGPDNAARPFLLRGVGPVGFGTRPSDAVESLFRDYLWLNFRDPGNLTRYFYHWVAHGYLDYQLGWHSVTNHWLTNRLVYQLGPTVANTTPQRQRLGMLLPRATLDLFDGASYYPYMGWDWALHAAKLPYTRVDERVIGEGRLGELGLEALILPEVRAMDDRVAAEIGKWVAAGGLLIASAVPGRLDPYGRPRAETALEKVLGVRADGVGSEPVEGTPLTVTIPRGHFTGRWAESTGRRGEFETLQPAGAEAKVLARYAGGKPAIVLHPHGKGRAVTIGYPFGQELVECERTSIGFQRTYVWFVREPQLVARVQWLREFLADDLGFRPDYEVEYAEAGRFKGNEAVAPGLHTPKGLSDDPAHPYYARTVGDPRAGHEIEVDRESPDLAIRFFPRGREGLPTRYLGISTREVHYLSPRATVNMALMRHTYHCRIRDPNIAALWDVARNVPVGFHRDEQGVRFTVELPSGQIMMLAVSRTPRLELFAPAAFPGRDKDELLGRCRKLAGGVVPPPVALLTPAAELRAWMEELGAPLAAAAGAKPPAEKPAVVISYGQPANKPAADKLAAFLKDRFGLQAEAVEQCLPIPDKIDTPLKGFEKAVVLIGDEWTNNDMAMHGAYWGLAYGAHLPFTATYAWPGAGRAVVALSRKYALMDDKGNQPFAWSHGHALRPVDRRFPLLRRKLHIAANGEDAVRAVDAILKAPAPP